MMQNDATTLSLAGAWGFRLDPERRGVAERWFDGALPDSIALPGSTDDAGYGRENDAREVTYLTRTHVFEGQGPGTRRTSRYRSSGRERVSCCSWSGACGRPSCG